MRTKEKYRNVYSDRQRLVLEREFLFCNKFLTLQRKTELAEDLGLSERQIKIWFQNRRAKDRRIVKKHLRTFQDDGSFGGASNLVYNCFSDGAEQFW